MKHLKKKITALALCAAAMFSVVLAEPGAQDDPLITKSYVENSLIPQLKEYINSRISESGTAAASQTVVSDGGERSFNVVEVSKGSAVLGAAGTEIIMRMGTAKIIATEKGGIADVTAGYDLADGEKTPSNHLLIVPVSDGRGIKAETDVILMIKGGYTVK